MSDDRKQLPAVITAEDHSRVTRAILDFVSDIPGSKVGPSGEPVSLDTTQEYSGKTTDAACDVRASFTSDYQPAKR